MVQIRVLLKDRKREAAGVPGRLPASSLAQNCVVVRDDSKYFLAHAIHEPPPNPKENFIQCLNYYYTSEGNGMGSNYGMAGITMKNLHPSAIVIYHDGKQIELKPTFVSNQLKELVLMKPLLSFTEKAKNEGEKVILKKGSFKNAPWFCK